MDTLSWTKLNPTVNFYPTKKLFYNKFLYKVKIYCPGSRLVLSKSVDLLEKRLISRLLVPDVSYNYGGSWWLTQQRKRLLEDANFEQLVHYFNIKNSIEDIKLRIEEPNIDIYANNEQLLIKLVSTNHPDRILEVYRPNNDNAADLLMNGEIIAHHCEKYEYKVFVKRMFFDNIQLKYTLLDHLYNYESEVKLPRGLIQNLNSSKSFFPGGYFYMNDLKVVTFISLICPEFISKIFKLSKIY